MRTEPSIDVGRRMATGAAWMVLAKLVERSLGVVSTLILARLLVPADFGLVAVATAVVAIVELLTGFGFDLALIRDQRATREHYDTAWTLNVLVGVIIAVLLLVLAVPAAGFFSDDRLVWILIALAITPALTGLENIGVVAFRKELNFRREFVFLSAKKLIMFFTAVPLAVVLGNYWALVAGITVGRLVATALSYWMHPYRPRWSLARAGELMVFSKWILMMNVIMFFKVRLPDIVIGRLSGPAALGVFNVGSEIASLPTTELVAPINRAVFPGYSMMGGEIAALRRAYLSVTGVVALVTLPAGAAIAAMAPILVPLLLGPKWLEAIPVIQIVAFFGMTTALQSNSFSIFLALGLARIPAVLGAVHVLLLFVALPLGVSHAGIVGAAWATLGVGLLLLPVNFALLLRLVACPLRELLACLWRPLLGTALLFLGLKALVDRLSPDSLIELLAATAGATAAATLGYAALVLSLWALSGKPPGAESLAVARLSAIRR